MSVALLLTLLAGLASVLGGIVGTWQEKPSNRSIAFSLGFAAGIMLMISLTEMLPATLNGKGRLALQGYLAFIIGLLGFFALDYLMPHKHPVDMKAANSSQHQLRQTAFLLVLGISLHNFPEGMATYLSATKDFELGMGVALAVALHNFPEGIAVAAPIYLLTHSKSLAIFWASIAALAEILGGVLAFLLWSEQWPVHYLDISMAFVAGIMVAISIDELMPLSKNLSPELNPSIGIFSGMAIMGLSLVLLRTTF